MLKNVKRRKRGELEQWNKTKHLSWVDSGPDDNKMFFTFSKRWWGTRYKLRRKRDGEHLREWRRLSRKTKISARKIWFLDFVALLSWDFLKHMEVWFFFVDLFFVLFFIFLLLCCDSYEKNREWFDSIQKCLKSTMHLSFETSEDDRIECRKILITPENDSFLSQELVQHAERWKFFTCTRTHWTYSVIFGRILQFLSAQHTQSTLQRVSRLKSACAMCKIL